MTKFFFAPCPRGLESVLHDELVKLNAQSVRATDGGVQFSGEIPVCYRANLESRIASRILWQIVEGTYKTEQEIYQLAHQINWPEFFNVDRTIAVKLTAIKSPLRSLDFVTLKIKDAICDKFRDLCGSRPNIEKNNPDIRIHAFLTASTVTLYIDTSGPALFQRGFRKQNHEAPLRENLAAGILSLAHWQPGIPLFDPMCGGGTFLIEAAMKSLNIAPGSQRHFAFEKLENYDAERWQQMREESIAREKIRTTQPIFGSDLYGDALKIAHANLSAAGLEEVVRLKQANVLETSVPAEEGIVVMNPPYGVRLDEQLSLSDFYPRLGDAFKKKFGGWRVYILTADMRLPKLIRLAASRRTPLFNGPLECRLFEYTMVKGSMRRNKAPT